MNIPGASGDLATGSGILLDYANNELVGEVTIKTRADFPGSYH